MSKSKGGDSGSDEDWDADFDNDGLLILFEPNL